MTYSRQMDLLWPMPVRSAFGPARRSCRTFNSPSPVLFLSIVDENGAPLAGAELIQRDLNRERRIGKTDGEGRFTCRSLLSAVGDLQFESSVVPRYPDRLEGYCAIDGVFESEDSVPATLIAVSVSVRPNGLARGHWQFDDAVVAVGETLDLGTLVYGPESQVDDYVA